VLADRRARPGAHLFRVVVGGFALFIGFYALTWLAARRLPLRPVAADVPAAAAARAEEAIPA